MKATEFAFWMQGLFELADPKSLDERQTDLIKRHLAMVFKHDIDPSYPAAEQKALNEIHHGQFPAENAGLHKVKPGGHINKGDGLDILMRC